MQSKRDYYEILGLSRIATAAEIRRAFRRRSRELHPDVNPSPDATRQFQELNEAYQTLSNSARRARYDRLSDVPLSRAPAATPQPPKKSPSPEPWSEEERAAQDWARHEWAQARAKAEQARQQRASQRNPGEYREQQQRGQTRPLASVKIIELIQGYLRHPLFWAFAPFQVVAVIAVLSEAPYPVPLWLSLFAVSLALPIFALQASLSISVGYRLPMKFFRFSWLVQRRAAFLMPRIILLIVPFTPLIVISLLPQSKDNGSAITLGFVLLITGLRAAPMFSQPLVRLEAMLLR